MPSFSWETLPSALVKHLHKWLPTLSLLIYSFFKVNSYWSVVALQCWVSFCCTARWISYEVKWSEVAQLCLTLCDPTDCSLPGSSVHGIFQAIVLELIAISFSRGSSQPRDQTQVSLIIDRRFTVWTTSFSLILVPTCWMGLAFPWGCITSWYGLKNLKRDCVLQYISIFHEGGHI